MISFGSCQASTWQSRLKTTPGLRKTTPEWHSDVGRGPEDCRFRQLEDRSRRYIWNATWAVNGTGRSASKDDGAPFGTDVYPNSPRSSPRTKVPKTTNERRSPELALKTGKRLEIPHSAELRPGVRHMARPESPGHLTWDFHLSVSPCHQRPEGATSSPSIKSIRRRAPSHEARAARRGVPRRKAAERRLGLLGAHHSIFA